MFIATAAEFRWESFPVPFVNWFRTLEASLSSAPRRRLLSTSLFRGFRILRHFGRSRKVLERSVSLWETYLAQQGPLTTRWCTGGVLTLLARMRALNTRGGTGRAATQVGRRVHGRGVTAFCRGAESDRGIISSGCRAGRILSQVTSDCGFLFLAAGVAVCMDGPTSWVSLRCLRCTAASRSISIRYYGCVTHRSFSKLRNILIDSNKRG